MKLIYIFLATMATASFAFAQTGTVRKVKGKSAIIKFDKTPDFGKGDRISIGGDSSSSMSRGKASRNYSLSLSAGIESETETVNSVDTDTDSMSIATVFMFNKGIFEYGGGFTYLTADNGTSDTTEYSMVGVGEYNFVENKPGTMFVPSVQGMFGIANYESGSASGNGLSYGLGGRLKMFPWNDSFAIVAAAGLTSSTIDVGNGIEIERTSTEISAGIQGYF